ncbi:sulfite exporter TauE/SafE family protein [Rubinisphaera italica]|uniref:Urease accessory protein UreH-like transmembrane domain-containing protein n=1 Tax=Rubinisphaera italica TaxID=2527969 RepID=A0A5C5XBP0_9PLAN|nr:sulfite exporter TauE/SafE family protein [Rubinisphaera italica]TWT60059.1 hypothetical protein Pan54_07710 [Rubinisphaera italica]
MEPNLISIAIAVLTASLVGSAHCVGMCGPFVILAAGSSEASVRFRLRNLTGYHAGRGMTYALIGVMAGWAGSWLDVGGRLLGWQQTAAWLTGLAMILFGIIAILNLRKRGSVHFSLPVILTTTIRKFYQQTRVLSAGFRAVAIGGITGFLPCGWLYAFVILAIGTSHPFSGAIIMLAFWMGTIPALSLLSIGMSQLSDSAKAIVPYCTAAILILGGLFTVSVRSFADLSPLDQTKVHSEKTIEALEEIQNQPLPCCHQDLADEELPNEKPLPPCCQNQ